MRKGGAEGGGMQEGGGAQVEMRWERSYRGGVCIARGKSTGETAITCQARTPASACMRACAS